MEWQDKINNTTDFITEKAHAPIEQKKELQKQTFILEEAKNITTQNAEYIKQIADYTIRNEKSSKQQFIASIIIASVALLVSIIALFQ